MEVKRGHMTMTKMYSYYTHSYYKELIF